MRNSMYAYTFCTALAATLSTPYPTLAQNTVVTSTSPGLAPHAPVSFTVQPIALTVPAASVLAARKASYTVTVPGTGVWVDTGIAVTPSDHIEASATGILTLADGRTSAPAGITKGWKDLLRGFPAEGANTAALVARIGSSAAAEPFALGAAQSRDMPAAGELFLAANTGDSLAGTGQYSVALKLSKATGTVTTVAPINLRQVLTPAVFARVPQRVADQQGHPGDLVNFAIIGTEDQVKKSFTAADWVQVDKTTDEAVLHGLLATLSKQAYLEMPMSTLYLFGRPQDMSYARADPLMVALERHHLRVWNSGQTVAGQPLWVGSATHDHGLERDDRNNGVTHHIDPNIDVERDFIEQSFAGAGALTAGAYVTPEQPLRTANTATGGSIQTDGRVLVVVLRAQ